MSSITDLGFDKKYTKENELSKRIRKVISEYDGELSLVSVVGILQLHIHELIQSN